MSRKTTRKPSPRVTTTETYKVAGRKLPIARRTGKLPKAARLTGTAARKARRRR